MKKSTLIKLHIYAGLFTCFYLLAFGVSTIILNHKLDVERKAIRKTWHDQISVDRSLDDAELAASVRDQLGIMGWLPRWQFRKDSSLFRFQTAHFWQDQSN